jgi:hypothetical protein
MNGEVMFKRLNLKFMFVAVLFLLLPGVSQATGMINTSSPNILVDEFDQPLVPPNTNLPWDYWYKLLISADAQGYYRRENLQGQIHCNVDVCVTRENEQSLKYARLAINPIQFPTADHVSIAQIGEQRDSFAYGMLHRWLPTVGHPIVYKVRFRASSTYKDDASGSAVGNWGITLFNYADYFTDPNANVSRDDSSFSQHSDDYYLLGFTWFDPNNVGGALTGLYAASADKFSFAPGFLYPVRGFNINDWTEAKITWEVNAQGVQTVGYYINDQLISTYQPQFPMPSLAIEIYNDNESFQFSAGGLTPVHVDIPGEQYIDLDSVDIRQL